MASQPRRGFSKTTIASAFSIVVLASLVFWFSRTDAFDPVYNGRRLTAWLQDLDEKPDQVAAAKQAIFEMGTNVVPPLLELRFKPDTRMDRFLATLLKPINQMFRAQTEKRRYQARAGLMVLGTNAAFSLISRFAVDGPSISVRANPFQFENHPIHQLADVMLFDLQTNSVAALIHALQSGNRSQRYNVCYAVWSHPTVEVHGNNALAARLIDAIIPCLGDESPDVVSMALYALTGLRERAGASETIVRSALPLLRHPHSGVRFAAALFFEASPDPSVNAALKEALKRERNTTQDDIPENTLVGRRSKAEVIQMLTVALRNDPEK